MDRIIEAKDTAFHGRLQWEGSPAHLQFNKLQGEITFRSVKGRFLNSNARTDFMRVINVFNFNAWARRLKLDFSDLYKSGVSYDSLNGHAILDRGVMTIDQPLVMESPSSRFTFQGKIDNINGKVDADLAVTLPVGDNAAWVTALAGGLPAAVGVWAVSKIFKKQIDNFSTVIYTVSGDLESLTRILHLNNIKQISHHVTQEYITKTAISNRPGQSGDRIFYSMPLKFH